MIRSSYDNSSAFVISDHDSWRSLKTVRLSNLLLHLTPFFQLEFSSRSFHPAQQSYQPELRLACTAHASLALGSPVLGPLATAAVVHRRANEAVVFTPPQSLSTSSSYPRRSVSLKTLWHPCASSALATGKSGRVNIIRIE